MNFSFNRVETDLPNTLEVTCPSCNGTFLIYEEEPGTFAGTGDQGTCTCDLADSWEQLEEQATAYLS